MHNIENYYEVLECPETATLEELKKKYQTLVKQHHPDKGSKSYERFVLLDKAYKTLKDEKSRKDYDAELLAQTCNEESVIYASLNKKDINLNSDGIFGFTCRCGGEIPITEEHLCEDECIVECSECSNAILIK
ncbi:dnaJ homolog subfamily C member 24-like [Sitophilus oryzae]|uniref:DnaJ homolog subfamily C member 24-like n=1 Tax=Sitophilus oryzae TaxID=7048 RepID=A0A6J2Y6A0_SITOR|nr:dnaJ homolog subfamily C member 24-like [Sitophilus oryzae]